MPTGRSPSDQGEVFLKSLFLVVQKRPNRADVENRKAVPSLREHFRNDRKEGRLGFASGSRRKNHEIGPREKRIDGQRLNVSQFPPTKGIHDVVLERRV